MFGNECCLTAVNTNTNAWDEGEEGKDAILLHCGMCFTGHFMCIFSLNLQQFCEEGALSDFPNKEPGAQSARWLTKTHAHSRGLRPGGNPQSLSIKPLFPLCCLFRGCDYLDLVKGTERELLGALENSPSCPVPSWGAEVEGQGRARGAVHEATSLQCLLLGKHRAEWSPKTVLIYARCWELYGGRPLNGFFSGQRQALSESALLPSRWDVRTCFLLIFKSNSGPNW